jgi:L-iditol 2-dehydrogenase
LADEADVFKIPDAISFAEATQIQTFSTVYHSQKRLRIEPGTSVMVLGLGVSGFLHLQLAKASGATPIIAAGRSAWKLELAKKLGVAEIVKMPDDNAIDKIRNLTGGLGPDAVIEAAGTSETMIQSIETVAPGGKVLSFGAGHQLLTRFDPYLIYLKEINIIGSRAASRADWQPAINLVKSGNINLKPLVTHILPLREIQKAFALMDEKAPGLIRIAIEMPEGEAC